MPKRSLQALLLALLLMPQAHADAVDDFIKAQMTAQHIAGLSVGVIIKDKIVKVKGYGLANVELNVPATDKTVFEIGSITKPFTSTAIMMLVEEGKIELDEKVSKYLPGIPDSWKDVTIRNLLTHTSGIKSYTRMPELIGQMRQGRDHKDILKLIEGPQLDFAPGTKWDYDNSGYYILGLVIESISGEPYGDFLKQRIFQPLGLETFCLCKDFEIINDRCNGYHWDPSGLENSDYVSMSWLYAAGGLAANMKDFAKWAAALYDGKLLKPESFEQMYTPAKLADGTTHGYGFGWALDQFRGHAIIEHEGGISGFATALVRWPKDSLAVAVFTNTDTCDPQKIAMGVSSLYMPAVTPLSMLQPKADPDPRYGVALRALIMQFAAGDPPAAVLTDKMKKSLTSDVQPIYKDAAAHFKEILYLDEDPLEESGMKKVYYKLNRDDGAEYFTLDVTSDGRIAGVRASPVDRAP